MQTNFNSVVVDDDEIVELEFADTEDLEQAGLSSDLAPAGLPTEVDSAATFTLTVVATVLIMVIGVLSQLPGRKFAIPDEQNLEPESHLGSFPLDALRQLDADASRLAVTPRYYPPRESRPHIRNRKTHPSDTEEFRQLPIGEKLQFPMTLHQEASFETIVGLISERTGIPIRFNFQDLRAAGIQKIRIIEIDSQQQSIEAVLCDAVRQNNPSRTEAVSELGQSLVYVVAPDGESLILTSRRRADERGTLPDVFTSAQRP
jgi:hypothetical protein